jgi:hypothetical protein
MDFLARIDELSVVADDKTRKGVAWDLNISNAIEELMWKAIESRIPTQFYGIDGFCNGSLGTCLKERSVPVRVAAQDKERKELTAKLAVVRLDCDWGSSGLWDECGRMIPYDYIDLPLPLIRRIIDWHEEFDATLDEVTSHTGPSEEWDEKHEREERKLALDLQNTLGPNTEVKVMTEQGWKSTTSFSNSKI